MFDLVKMKYKKSHLLVLGSYKGPQKLQNKQQKTFDKFVFKVANPVAVRYNEFESLRRILSRKIFKLLRFSLATKPYIAVTAKPREIRMGKGKGAYSHSQLVRKVGQRFASVAWCHRQTYAPLLIAVKNSVKKSSQRLSV